MGKREEAGPRGLRPVIAIDGPAGVGKSTTAREVARRLGFMVLDSGALYRAVAISLPTSPPDDEDALTRLLEGIALESVPDGEIFRMRIEGREVEAQLRATQAGERASQLATHPVVRAFVGRRLRALAERYSCVAEGRDMGTAVFPQAALKIFLSASLDARAGRRQAQLREGGVDLEAAEVREGIERRDERDRSRAASPLRAAEDAIQIDNTRLSFAEQVDLIVSLYRGGGWLQGSRAHQMVRLTARALFRVMLNGRVAGRERLPKGACLLASNHKSYLDPPIVGSVGPGKVAFLAKEELFRLPGMGGVMRGLGAVAIRRGMADRRALKVALDLLGRGMPVVVFPEGTRIRGPGLGEPHPGISLLARRSQLPVVPVRIWGSDRFWQAFLRRRSAWVLFGEPLAPPRADDPGSGRRFAEQVMTAIGALRPPG
ncbi:MAG: (d)CMP kinase [Candidatus Eisenbacteria bacterium]